MGPCYAYQAYEATRVKTAAERREADIPLGQLAAAVSRLLRLRRSWYPTGRRRGACSH